MKQPETIPMSIMSDMAKNDAYYKGKKLIGCVFDPTGFKKPDGSLDSAAMADEMFKWAQSQFKKIDDAKKAEADATVDEK
jgi:hypothetical protein